MKSIVALIVTLLPVVTAFSGSSFTGQSVGVTFAPSKTMTMEYIPTGMSKEQWRKLKEKERNANQGKNLGKVGITTFKSRSFSEWQASGGKNLFPVNPKDVKDPKDLPYMQRPGGSADNADLQNPLTKLFSGFAKKKEEPEPEPEKKNWWTL